MSKKMDEKMFWAIKTLLAGGATSASIADYYHIGLSTVGRVKASENLTEYHNILAAMYATKKGEPKEEPVKKTEPQVVEHRQTVTVQATHYTEAEIRKHTEQLELISRKMSAMLDIMNSLLGCWKTEN